MDQYVPDDQLYTPDVEGFTSDDEFSLDKRVQITNEVPTLDAFENLHSVMQNSLWRWFVGSNRIMFETPFNFKTKGWEYRDQDGQIVSMSNSKYVNGIRIRDYGPQPTKLKMVYSTYRGADLWYHDGRALFVYDGATDYSYEVVDGSFQIDGIQYGVKPVLDPGDDPRDFVLQQVWDMPKGVRYEVNGSVLPEFDLLLHEGYRYLQTLYPDHPKWAELLTDNEIDDQIVDSAAIIDYVPNVKLFRQITDGLDYGRLDGAELYRARSYEAVKLEVRNLLDEARRRKLYGSKIGYTMFVNDALFDSNVYNVSRYRPYLQVDPNTEPTSRQTNWYMDIFPEEKASFENRPVNWFSRNWDRPFKLIDWRNASYDYTVPEYVPELATGYAISYDRYGLWEILDDSWGSGGGSQSDTDMSSFSDYYVGQYVTVDGVTVMVQRMDVRPRTQTVFEFVGGWTHADVPAGVVSRMLTSSPVDPSWDDLYVYSPPKLAIDKLISDLTMTEELAAEINADGTPLGTIRTIHANTKKVKTQRFEMSPLRPGALYMPWEVSIGMYPDVHGAKVKGSAWNARVEYGPDVIHKKWTLVPGSVLSQNVIDGSPDDSFVEVTKTTKATMYLDRFDGDGFFSDQAADLLRPREMAFEMITDAGTVMVTGISEFRYADVPDADGRYYVTDATVKVTSIPLFKDRWMMERCYSLFVPRVQEKVAQLETLFGAEPKGPYSDYVKLRDSIQAKFEEYMRLTRLFVEDPPTSNRDERVIAHTAAYKAWVKVLPSDKKKAVAEKAYEDWKNVRDFREDAPAKGEKEFSKVSRDLISKSTSYEGQTIEDLMCELALHEDRAYYDLDLDAQIGTVDIAVVNRRRAALARIHDIDRNFDSWTANRWLAVDPTPVDPWDAKPKITDLSVQSFREDGTRINAVYTFEPSPLFAEDVDYLVREEFGFCYLDDWQDGWLSVVQICDRGELVTEFLGFSADSERRVYVLPPGDVYHRYGYDTSFGEIAYYDLDPSLIEYVASISTHEPGPAFVTGDWWEDLDSYRPNNVRSVEEKTYEVKINLAIDVDTDPYVMTAFDEYSKYILTTLNPGDAIYPDVYSNEGNLVETVDWDQGTVRSLQPLLMSGTFTVKFITRLNVVMDTSEQDNFWRYRYDLQENGLLDSGDPFEHGFYPSKAWPDETSGAQTNSPIDSKWFKSELLDRLQSTNAKFADGFNGVVLLNYRRDFDLATIPSLIDDQGDLFWELSPTKVLGFQEESGRIISEGKLVPIELHDYMDDNLLDVSRATDLVNVGTNITMETDNSGKFTPFAGKRWTDDSIHSRFRTLGWTEDTIPYYIEVGTGRLDLFANQVLGGLPNGNDYSSARSYYEGPLGERRPKDERGDVYGAIGEDGWDGGFFSGDDIYVVKDRDYSEFGIKHVAEPQFEVPIGEYELRRYVNVESDPGVFYTLVHSSIMKQEFTDLLRSSEIVMNFEKTFGLDILSDVSIGMFKDPKTGIELIGIEDIRAVTFDGEYVPSTKLNGVNYEIVWPGQPVFDDSIHYRVVKSDVVISNIYDPQDLAKGIGSISFSQMSLIVYQWNSWTNSNLGGRWVQKEFRFGGIFGSTPKLTGTLVAMKDSQEILDPDLGTTYMPGVDYENTGKADVEGADLLHRILTKMLGQTEILSGSSVYTRTFTFAQTQELLVRIYEASEGIWRPTVDQVQAWIDANFAGAEYSWMIPKNWDNMTSKRGKVADLTKAYWFVIGPVALIETGKPGYNNGWQAMYNVGLTPGSLVSVMYDQADRKFVLNRVNNSSKWSYLLNTEHMPGMSESEWLTFCRENGTSEIGDNEFWLPIDRKEDIFTTIQLERSRILAGSFNLKLRIDPDFTSDGWEFTDYRENGQNGAKLYEERIIASESPIFVDEDLKVLYVYNHEDPRPDVEEADRLVDGRYVLKIRENRFFKNALFVIGNYSLDELEVDGVIKKVPRVHAIDGVSFDIDFLSAIDRLLRFNRIKIRSNYSKMLEDDLYSSYVNLKGTLRGLYKGGDDGDLQPDWFLMLGFEEDKGSQLIANRITSGAEFKKAMPTRVVGSQVQLYSDTDVDFNVARWPGSTDLIERPTITEFDVRRRISTDHSDLTFQYMRNTLILEGKLNTAAPYRIDFGENERLKDALDHVLVGDSVLSISSIDYSKYNDVTQFVFQPSKYFSKDQNGTIKATGVSGTFDVVKIDYREGWIVGATDSGVLLASRQDSLLSLPNPIPNTIVFQAANGTNMKLTGLSFDEREHGWLVTYSGNEGKITLVVPSEDQTQVRIEDVGNVSGVDINTYQMVQILDVDGKTDTATVDRNVYRWIRARDMAFTAIPVKSPSTPTSLLSGNIVDDQQTSVKKMVVTGENTSGPEFTKYREEAGYSTFEVLLRNESGPGVIDFGIRSSATDLPMYRFDRILNEWVKTTGVKTTQGGQSLYPIVSNWRSTDTVSLKTYLVSPGFTVDSNDMEENYDISLLPPPPPIPSIELEGLTIEDPEEGGLYPPPRVPYSSKNVRISRYHPIFTYIKNVLLKGSGLSAANPRYGSGKDSFFKYTVLEDVFEDVPNKEGGGKDRDGSDTYLSRVKEGYQKGQVAEVVFDEDNPPYIWECAWWCLTNDLAPAKSWTDDYGLRAYVEMPPVTPNDEIQYQFGYEGGDVNKVVGRKSKLEGLTVTYFKGYIDPGDDLNAFCVRKNSVPRIPPYDKIEIPLEYQSIYVRPDPITKTAPDPERFYTEFLIYSIYYQDYVSEYNSYIASDDFRRYIDLLRSQWLYIGEQASAVVVYDDPNFTNVTVYDDSTLVESTVNQEISKGFYALQRLEEIPLWLKKLPPPESTLGTEVTAVKMTSQGYMGWKISDGSTQFAIIRPLEKSVPIAAVNYNPPDANAKLRREGLYNPFATGSVSSEPKTPYQSAGLSGPKYTCHNKKGNVAVVIGDQLFFYGKTQTYGLTSSNPLSFHDSTPTDQLHWKRASLPHRRHVELDLLNDMELTEALKYVVQIRAQWLRLVDAIISPNAAGDKPTNDQASLDALKKIREWVLNNPVQGYRGEQEGPEGSNVKIENNSPFVYTDTNQISTVIHMSAPTDTTKRGGAELKVTFNDTENGVIPVFGEVDYTFISREDDGTGRLSKQNFYQYLLYYMTYILGNERFENLIDDGIKKVFMSEQYLCIQTSTDDLLTLPLSQTLTREQIEDYANWSVSSIDPQYIQSSMEGTLTRRKSVVISGQQYNFGLWPVEKSSKGFHINQIECIDNAIVVAGYVQASEVIQAMADEQTTYTVINELYPNDSWRTFYLTNQRRFPKYPVVFYSNDGGRSFKKCKLPAIEFIPNIKSYNGEYTDSAGSTTAETNQSDIEAFSIHIHGNDVHIWFKNSNPTANEPDPSVDKSDKYVKGDGLPSNTTYAPLGYTTFESTNSGSAIELTWLENITRIQKKTADQLKTINDANDPNKNVDLVDVQDALAGTIQTDKNSGSLSYSYDDVMEFKLSRTRSITEYGQSMISPVGGMYMIIQQPFLFIADQIEVTKISDQTIEVTPPDITAPNYKAEDIRVLVSINPSRPVMDQAVYLEAKQEYLNWRGNFIVPEFVDVEDAVMANRMYSFRETLETKAPGQDTIPNRELTPKRGIPAVSEDRDHAIYEYYDAYIDRNGDEVWDIIPAKNSAGQEVFLVNKEGNYLVERDSWKSNNFVRLFKMIEQGTPAATLTKAPRVSPDYDVTVQNERLTAILNGVGYDDPDTPPNGSVKVEDVGMFRSQQRIRYIDTRVDDPKVLIESKYIGEIMNLMTFPDEGPSQLDKATILHSFYRWPIKNGGAATFEGVADMGPPNARGASWYTTFAGLPGGVDNDRLNKTEFFEYIAFLEELEGAFGSSSNPGDPRTRLSPIKVGNEWVIFDNEIGVIPVRFKDEVTVKARVAYVPDAGIQQYVAGQFSFDRDGRILSPNPDYPITGVWIDPKGYGGSMNNTSWDREQPWDIDYEAYTEQLVRNVNDDLVYMVREGGSKLISNYGLDYISSYDEVTIRYDDLVYDDQLVTSWNEGAEYDEGFEYHVYKRPEPRYEIWTPRSEIVFDVGAILNESGDFVHRDGYIDTSKPSHIDHSYTSYTVDGYTIITPTHGLPIDGPGKRLLSDCVYLFKDDFEVSFDDIDPKNGEPMYRVRFYDEEGALIENMGVMRIPGRYHRAGDGQLAEFTVWNLYLDLDADGDGSVSRDEYEAVLRRSPFIGDYVKMEVIDQFGLKVERVFNVRFGFSEARVIEAPPVTYYGSNLFSMSTELNMWYDPRTLTQTQRFVSNDQGSVVMKGSMYSQGSGWAGEGSDSVFTTKSGSPAMKNGDAGFYVSINFNEKPNVTFFNSLLGVSSIEFQENVRTIGKLDFCFERDWKKSDEADMSATIMQVYSGETDITAGFQVGNELEPPPYPGAVISGKETNIEGWTFSVGEHDGAIIVAKHGTVQLTTPMRVRTGAINTLKFSKITFTRNEESTLYHPMEPHSERVLIKGLRTPMLFRRPVYGNFKELLTMKKQTISLNEAPVVERGLTDFNMITEIDPSKQFFVLQYPLPDDGDLNDGRPHEMKVKVLTTNTTQLAPEFMNHPDYIVEIPLTEIEKFGYERVFFDPEGYPQPPIKIDDHYHYLEHADMYEGEAVVFKNTNGFKVHQADGSGNYIRWTIQNGVPTQRILGDPETGDCRRDVFGSVDRRYVPRRPIFNSSYEWFVSQYYLRGKEKNPFWQTLEVRDLYDQKLKSWSQKIYTKRWEKSVDEMVEAFVPKGEEYVFIENGIVYEYDNGAIKSVISDYIDYEDGRINFILGFPAKTYYDSKYLIKYGLYVKNQFYPGEKNKQIWNSWVKMKFQESYDFIVNSKENIANPNDKELAIVPIREMGLFDRSHRLIAYSTFPDVEYRSDRQHISFTLAIRNAAFDVAALQGSQLATMTEDLNR